MMTVLDAMADLLMFVMLILHDRRIAELEQKLEDLNARHVRLARRM